MRNRLAAFFLSTAALIAACGGGVSDAASAAPGSSPAPGAGPSPGDVAPVPGTAINANPTNYLSLLSQLKPGDTLLLAPGNYGVNARGEDTDEVPGLPIFNLNGTAAAPITIMGAEGAPLPVLLGRSTHNTVRVADSSYVVLRNLEIDNRGLGAAGVASQGVSHHITLENLYIHGVGDDQQTVGIAANSAASWNWVIRNNRIIGAGTGMYLGSSTGNVPFVAGLIEHNLIQDTIGYNIEIKHQNAWTNIPAGMPTGATTTVVRHNVLVKRSSFVSEYGARPNLLVGDQPPSGPGSSNGHEIYGNFFFQNPTEVLFQGEGNIAFHHNVLVNTAGSAMAIQRHNGLVRTVHLFANTILARDIGIAVSGGLGGSLQRVTGNAVFAATPITVSGADAAQSDNVVDTQAAAATYLINPIGGLGAMNLYPKAGALQGSALNTSGLTGYTDWNLDFNGVAEGWTTRGAYGGTGTNPGWVLSVDLKP